MAGNNFIVYLYQIFCLSYLPTQGISQVLYLIICEPVIIKFDHILRIDFLKYFKVVPSQQAYIETNPHEDVWKLLP